MPKPSSARATCLQDHDLRDLMEERLNPKAEASATAHIDDCVSCQARLEDLAGHRSEWEQLRGEFDGSRSRSGGQWIPDALGAQGSEEPEGDRDMRALQSYFGPTDDPTKMGRLGHYEVIGFVGKGSTGVVVKAHEPRLGRFVAIKVLSPSFASNGPARARFQREARAIAAVSHEHVVPVFAVDEYEGLPYIVMQYASGGSLEQRIERDGPLDSCETMRVGIQIARGLAEAHSQGIVHRDVKPANVMLEGGVERVMVTDFGLARVADEAAMTRSGVVAGTPQYMSPEQAQGESVDPRSDLFSLGSVLYTALTGRSPFRAGSVFGVIKRVCDDEPRRVRELAPSVEPWLEAFIGKLMEKSMGDRFGSAAEVAEVLAGELAHAQNPTVLPAPERPWWPRDPSSADGEGGGASPRGRWILGAACAAAAAAALWMVQADGAEDTGSGLSRAGFTALGGLAGQDAALEIVEDGGGSERSTAETAAESFTAALADVAEAKAPALVVGDEAQEGSAGGERAVIVEDLPIFAFENKGDVKLEAGGKLSISADYESIHVRRSNRGEGARVVVSRVVEAESRAKADGLLGLHAVYLKKDSEKMLKLVCELDPKASKGERRNPIRAVALEVWIPEDCDLAISSKSGAVRLDEVGAANVSAVTASGALSAEMDKVQGEPWMITSTSGAIALRIPKAQPASVTAKTQTGRISGPTSDVAVTGTWEMATGGGATPVYLSSTTGAIDVAYLAATGSDGTAELLEEDPALPPAPPETPGGEGREEIIEEPREEITEEPSEEITEEPREEIVEESREEITEEPSEKASEAPAPHDEDGDELCEQACDSPTDQPCEEAEPCELCEDCKAKEAVLSKEAADGHFAVRKGEFPGGVVDGYALYLPLSYGTQDASFPVIVSLAGGCYVGGEIECLLGSALPREMKARLVKGVDLDAEYDRLLLDSFIVVAPHMKAGSFKERQYFQEEEAMAKILDEVADEFRVDKARVYLTGGGRGGHGAWGLASRMPERFAATVPLRGETIGITDYAALAAMPVWTGHLTDDDEVPFEHAKEATSKIEALTGAPFARLDSLRADGDAYLEERHLLTSYRGDEVVNLYAHEQVFKWLLRHARASAPAAQTASEASAPAMEGDERFR